MVSVPGKMLSDHVNLKHRTLFTSEIKFTVVGMVKRQRLTTKLWCAKFVWLWGVVSARSYDNLEIGSLGYTADNIPYACINFHAKSIFRFRDIEVLAKHVKYAFSDLTSEVIELRKKNLCHDVKYLTSECSVHLYSSPCINPLSANVPTQWHQNRVAFVTR